MKKVYACGCVPFRRGVSREIEALMVLNRGGHWEFPKGHKEEGESDQDTALRELKEETGLTGEIQMETPIDTVYRFTRDREETEKHVRYFYCRVPDGSEPILDKHELADSAWLPLEMLADRATYPEMKEVARKVHLALGD